MGGSDAVQIQTQNLSRILISQAFYYISFVLKTAIKTSKFYMAFHLTSLTFFSHEWKFNLHNVFFY